MKKNIFILLLLLSFSTVIQAQNLIIETESSTDVYNIIDMDTIGVVRVELDAPIIYSINPNAGVAGDTIIIKGKNFLKQDTLSSTYVMFGSTKVKELLWNDTQITIIAPPDAKSSMIKVVVLERPSNEIQFTIIEKKEPPEILYIDPYSVKYGDIINIQGKNFGDKPEAVSFYIVDVNNFESWNDSLIVVKVPDKIESGMVYVKREGLKSNGKFLEIYKLPEVTSFSPDKGYEWDTVNIYGKNFGDLRLISRVWFGGTECADYIDWSDSHIKVLVPVNAKSGEVTIRIFDKYCSAGNFEVLKKENVVKLLTTRPVSGFPGDTVLVYGQNLGDERGTNSISINGLNTENYISWTNASVKILVPEGSGNVKIGATINNNKSNEIQFFIKDKTLICGQCKDADSNSYKTILIGKQCWMAENLNVGKQIMSTVEQKNNKIIEKYCFNDSAENCIKRGGLYDFEEIFAGDTFKIGQGICPKGWRLSTQQDYEILEIELDKMGPRPSRGKNLMIGGKSGFDGILSGYYDKSSKTDKFWEGSLMLWSPNRFNSILFRNWIQIDSDNHYGILKNMFPSYRGAKSLRCIKQYIQKVDSVFPNVVSYGQQITILGNNFGTYKDSVKISLNGVGISRYDITYLSNNEIRFRVPDSVNSGYLNLSIKKEAYECNKLIIIRPILKRAVPQSIEPGYTGNIKIYGKNLSILYKSDPSENEVYFGNLLASKFVAFGQDSIIYKIPNGVANCEIFIRKDSIYSNTIPFKINMSCGPCMDAEGKNYRTVIVGNQCWMGENLNTGSIVNMDTSQKDNGVIEKSCKDNLKTNCDKYGGLYQWNELMSYDTTESTRGICPIGWHVPSDAEWMELERYLGMSESEINNLNDWKPRGGEAFYRQLNTGGYSGLEITDATHFSSTSQFNNGSRIIKRWFDYFDLFGSWEYMFLRHLDMKKSKLSVRCVKDK